MVKNISILLIGITLGFMSGWTIRKEFQPYIQAYKLVQNPIAIFSKED